MAYITKKQDKKGANTMKKKYVVSLLLTVLTLSCSTVANAADNGEGACGKKAEVGHVAEVDVLEDYIPEGINDLCNVKVTRSASISVPVTSPCDQSWRKNTLITGCGKLTGRLQELTMN